MSEEIPAEGFNGYARAGLPCRAYVVHVKPDGRALPYDVANKGCQWYAVYPSGIAMACRNRRTAVMLAEGANGESPCVFRWESDALLFRMEEVRTDEGKRALRYALDLVMAVRSNGKTRWSAKLVADILALLPDYWQGEICCCLDKRYPDETVLRLFPKSNPEDEELIEIRRERFVN